MRRLWAVSVGLPVIGNPDESDKRLQKEEDAFRLLVVSLVGDGLPPANAGGASIQPDFQANTLEALTAWSPPPAASKG